MDSHLFQDTAHPSSHNHPCSSIHQWHHKMQFTRTDRYSHYPRKRQSSIVSRNPAAVTTRRQSSAPDRPVAVKRAQSAMGKIPFARQFASSQAKPLPKSRKAARHGVFPKCSPGIAGRITFLTDHLGQETHPRRQQRPQQPNSSRGHCSRVAQGGFRE